MSERERRPHSVTVLSERVSEAPGVDIPSESSPANSVDQDPLSTYEKMLSGLVRGEVTREQMGDFLDQYPEVDTVLNAPDLTNPTETYGAVLGRRIQIEVEHPKVKEAAEEAKDKETEKESKGKKVKKSK